MSKKLLRKVADINESIEEIRGSGLRLVTTTSAADIASAVIAGKGTGQEGRILSLKEINSQRITKGEKPMTRYEYVEHINDLIEAVGEQLTYEGQLDYSYDLGMSRLETYLERNPDFPITLDEFKLMGKEEFVDMIENVGELSNMETNAYGYASEDSFYTNLIEGFLVWNGD